MYLEKCNKNQLKEIYQEFNITEESLKRDVNTLMEWMEKQPHLLNVKDEDLLSHALIQCKYSIEKTKKHLDSYYCTKTSWPSLFTNRDPTDETFKKAFNVGCLIPLPKLTSEGYRVFIYRHFDPENSQWLTPEAEMKVTLTSLDINTKDDPHRSNICIYDLRNMSLTLAMTMFTVARKYSFVYQSLYSLRCHQLHLVITLSPTITTLINMTRALLKKKLADRLVVWTDEKPDFTSMISPEILPEDYGGKEKPLKPLQEMYYQYLCGFREWLKEDENMKADLSKRRDDVFGSSQDNSVHGSFRQLIID